MHLLQRAHDLQVESLLKGDAPDAITFEKIHGRNGKMIKAKDLDLLRFAPRGLPPEVSHLLPTSAQHADSMQALHWQPVLEESALLLQPNVDHAR